uniref:TRAP transporter large permease subunit n=2 Tax=Faecalibacterium prausnitzii TaxID=853 RepID=UPI003FF04A6F
MVVQATLLLFGSFLVMLLVGVPISAGIGIASIFTALFSMDPAIFALTAAQRCFSGIDSFSLLALPFFSLGGNIMNKGGIAKRLVRLARLAVGKMPGYLAATNVLASMFFGAVSGSSVAATSAMGSIMAPLELDEGYDPNYSAAVNICSAPTGILIPPSGPLILYSITAGGVSVAALFMGGYLPGILMGLCSRIPTPPSRSSLMQCPLCWPSSSSWAAFWQASSPLLRPVSCFACTAACWLFSTKR